MKYFIDSNIFIRVLHKENEKIFRECIALIDIIKTKNIQVATGNIVFAEVVWTLDSFYKVDKKRIIEGLTGLSNINGLEITDDYNNLLAIQLFQKYNIKFIDALIASNKDIFNKKMTVVSYDRDFDKLPVIRKEPGEIITKYN